MQKRLAIDNEFIAPTAPFWPCPHCQNGSLEFFTPSFYLKRIDEVYEHSGSPSDIKSVYSSLLECTNTRCKKFVSSSGTSVVYWVPKWCEDLNDWNDQEGGFEEYCYAQYFDPPLIFFHIPSGCPVDINASLRDSFKTFFCSISSSANAARRALEQILDDLNVPKTDLTRENKRKKLDLHNRILKLPEKYHKLKNMMLAIKWVGNAGSHASHIPSKDYVLDIYGMLEIVLRAIYSAEVDENLDRKATEINLRKGRPPGDDDLI